MKAWADSRACGFEGGICKATRAAASLTALQLLTNTPKWRMRLMPVGKMCNMKRHKLNAWQSLQSFATLIVDTYGKVHLTQANLADALIADGRAVRVAAQIFQHLGRTAQRGLGIHHPVVLVEMALPIPPTPILTLRIALDAASRVRLRQSRHELTPKDPGQGLHREQEIGLASRGVPPAAPIH